uniref:Putative octopamine receptor 2 n=1 Tax=Hirudo verbana TaxID=311461 RepID=A0A2S1WLX8_9ANNE|nr:putative octopamine receptor 2 [Hirudo verbana]
MLSPANQSSANVTILSLHHPHLPQLILVGSTLLSIIIITVLGNVLVMISLSRFKTLRTVSNLLIGNLAVSDFLLATTVLPFSAVYECLGRWMFGRAACNLWLLADVLYCTASIWNICIIALDRYTATLFPLWYRERRSSRQACLYVAAIWFIAAATCTPPLFGWNDLSENYVTHDNFSSVYLCILFQTPSYVVYSACFSFYVPFALTLLLYLQVVFVLKKRLKFIRKRSDNYSAMKPVVDCQPIKTLESGVGFQVPSYEFPQIFCHQAEDQQESADQNFVDLNCSTKSPVTHLSVGPVFTISDQSNNSISVEDVSDVHAVLLTPLSLHEQQQPRTNFSNRISLHVPGGKLTSLAENEAKSESLSPLSSSVLKGHDKHQDVRKASIVDRVKTPLKAENCGENRARKKHKNCAKKYERREMRATLRMAVVIGAFCTMWIGFFTLYLVVGLCQSCKIPRSIEAFVFWLGYSNSAINPFLYAIFNVEFRKAFKKVLGIRTIRKI